MWGACSCNCQGAQFWQWCKSRCSRGKRLVSCGSLHPGGDKEGRERPYTGGINPVSGVSLWLYQKWLWETDIGPRVKLKEWERTFLRTPLMQCTAWAIQWIGGQGGKKWNKRGMEREDLKWREGIRWMWDRGQSPPAVTGTNGGSENASSAQAQKPCSSSQKLLLKWMRTWICSLLIFSIGLHGIFILNIC